MTDFQQSRYCTIDAVDKHPQGDNLEIVSIGGWKLVTNKGMFSSGDNVIHIIPDSILPQQLYDYIGIKKYLVSLSAKYLETHSNLTPSHMRLKASKIRGVPSYGILLSPIDATKICGFDAQAGFSGWRHHKDIDNALGVSKWEPPIRPEGEKENFVNFERYTKVQHYQDYKHVFEPNELVFCTEKVHGKNCRLGVINTDEIPELVAGSRRIQRTDKDALCWQPYTWYPGIERLLFFLRGKHRLADVVLYGEIYGMYDTKYGLENKRLDFLAYDITVNGQFLNFADKVGLFKKFNVPQVPLIWSGPFSEAKIDELVDGPSLLVNEIKPYFTGREGIVITPAQERRSKRLERVILKYVSANFLGRNGALEEDEE